MCDPIPEHFVLETFHVDSPYEGYPFNQNKSTKYPYYKDLKSLSHMFS